MSREQDHFDISADHPEFAIPLNPDAPTLANIPQVEKPENRKLVIVLNRAAACQRLELLSNFDFKGWGESPLNVALSLIYGYDDTDLSEMTRRQRLRSLIGTDLLYREMFNADGMPSEFSDNHFPEVSINPDEYEVYGPSWAAIRETIAEWAPHPDDLEGSNYVGFIFSDTSCSDDPVERYSDNYGLGSIIALPYAINIGNESISVTHINDFQLPFGGHTYKDRLVLVPIGDKI